jgi:hypothetical protein
MRDFSPLYVRFGSGADKATLRGYVRFIPKSGQTADSSICPLCANTGHSHCSKPVPLFDHLVGEP